MDEPKDMLTIVKACALGVAVVVLTLLVLAFTSPEPARPAEPVKRLELRPAAALAPAPTTTTTAPAPTPAAWSAEVDQATPAAGPGVSVSGCYADLAVQVGWPPAVVPHLVLIMERESHCDPASNTGYRPSTGDWSLGLLQINTLGSLLEARQQACGITAREQLLDPATNLACGLALYQASGFAPWGG